MSLRPEFNVGQRIRLLRERQGLSLRALAERCGLSTTAISQIERGDNSPTVSSLHQLAIALGVSITDLFQDEHHAAMLIRPAERLRAEAGGVLMENLGLGLPYQQLEPFLVTLAPGAGNADQPVSHAGEEFVHCLEGAFDYCVADRLFSLEPGDSLLFEAVRPHYFHNPTDKPARFLLIFQAGGSGTLARRLHAETAHEAG
ncbi:MAG: helix-turn-helix transcriptional regulator [Anaerolineales bacterium]|nr:helix-turn-helix transcriptional regulator [Anaerolineales bacterium]